MFFDAHEYLLSKKTGDDKRYTGDVISNTIGLEVPISAQIALLMDTLQKVIDGDTDFSEWNQYQQYVRTETKNSIKLKVQEAEEYANE
jgi:hypothetical protein